MGFSTGGLFPEPTPKTEPNEPTNLDQVEGAVWFEPCILDEDWGDIDFCRFLVWGFSSGFKSLLVQLPTVVLLFLRGC